MAKTFKLLEGFHRHDIVNLLSNGHNIGVELGIAEGHFSSRVVSTGRFTSYVGVDMYADGHDVEQYKRALLNVGLEVPSYKLLRMTFDEALDLFEDGSLDFVYVDGYAHTGEEGGATIFKWFKKLKIGGLMSGDDYHDDWPLVMAAVDDLVEQSGGELMVTELTENIDFSEYPTWAMFKEEEIDFTFDTKAMNAAIRMGRERQRRYHLRALVRNTIPPKVLSALKRIRDTIRERVS